jgi:hypothetical protein
VGLHNVKHPQEKALVPSVRFEVLKAVVVKSSISWDIAPCSLLKVKMVFQKVKFPHILALFHNGKAKF